MTRAFSSPLAASLVAFLEFKRRRGYRYNRSEFTLRNFDRFVAARAKQDPSWRLDEVILAWLSSRPGRLAVSVSQEMAVVRQFWFYVRRHHPAQCRREIRWPKLPTKTSFTPQVLTATEVRGEDVQVGFSRRGWRDHEPERVNAEPRSDSRT